MSASIWGHAWPTIIPVRSRAVLSRGRSPTSWPESPSATRALATAPRACRTCLTGIPAPGRGPWREIDRLFGRRRVLLGRNTGIVTVLVHHVLHGGAVFVVGGILHRGHRGVGAILFRHRRRLDRRGVEPRAARGHRQCRKHQANAWISGPHVSPCQSWVKNCIPRAEAEEAGAVC